ncbi:MAG: sugar phosphate isomerase/epimerase family protein [Candidatus Bathyarchaeia archaeon]
MFRNLSPGAIGVKASLAEAVQLTRSAGFEGVDLDIREVTALVKEGGLSEVRGLFDQAGIRPGGWGLPVDWRGEEASYRAGLAQLRVFAEVASRLDARRASTWVLPFSDERPFKENFEWHVRRFEPIARILAEHGCSLGLEFIGPKTSRAKHRYEFIYTLEGVLELCEAISTGNVGLLLDSWHWYTSHGTLAELRKLKNRQVVYVHINDAPAGIPIDEHVDNVRCLPGETGVIDLKGFLESLKAIGYDGPVTPEPFSQKLRGMPSLEAAKVTGEALLKVWRSAGLT